MATSHHQTKYSNHTSISAALGENDSSAAGSSIFQHQLRQMVSLKETNGSFPMALTHQQPMMATTPISPTSTTWTLPFPSIPTFGSAGHLPTAAPFFLPRLTGFPPSSLISPPVLPGLTNAFGMNPLAMAFQTATVPTGGPLAPVIDPAKLLLASRKDALASMKASSVDSAAKNIDLSLGSMLSNKRTSSLGSDVDNNNKQSGNAKDKWSETASRSSNASPSSPLDQGADAPRKRRRISKKQRRRMNGDPEDQAEREFNGEERLAIQFESYGTIDPDSLARLGSHKGFIPNGLTGYFNMYAERWAFEVRHAGPPQLCKDGKKRILVEWSVRIYPHWKQYHRVVETVDEAQTRECRGFTLCNRVFREAMQKRAEEYEQLAKQEELCGSPNPLQVANFQRQAVFLRPEKVSEGPLLFGLRHKVVQDHIRQLFEKSATTTTPAAVAPGSNSSSNKVPS